MFLTLQELRLPHRKSRVTQTSCNDAVGSMATQCCGTLKVFGLRLGSGITGSLEDVGWKGRARTPRLPGTRAQGSGAWM